MAASRHLAWAHGTLAERRSRRLARCRSAAIGAQALRVREITPGAPGPLQSGPAHAAWEDRELGLVAVGVGAVLAFRIEAARADVVRIAVVVRNAVIIFSGLTYKHLGDGNHAVAGRKVVLAVVVCGETQVACLVIYDTMYRSIYHAVPAGNLQCVVRLAVLLDGDVVAVDLTSCPRFVGHYTPSVIRQVWAHVEPAQAYGV